MRTAEEIEQECYGKPPLVRVAIIQRELDKAIAHGMTLSAEIAGGETYADWPVRTEEEVSYDTACLDCKTAILTARDNKILRKE